MRGLERLPEAKVVTAERAVEVVRPGDRVFVGTGCATPRRLVAALEHSDRSLDDVQLLTFLTTGAVECCDGLPQTRFRHRTFFVGSDTRELVKQGRADYVPLSIARVPQLFETGRIPLEVALVQVAPPDEHGFVSLGVSVDVTRAAVRHARTVLAEVNPRMPRTAGDTAVHIDRFAAFVPVDEPVIEYRHAAADAVAERIARYVARIIDDGSTLQVGLGRIPNEMLKYLTERKDLGIHTDVITDPLVELIERGVVTGRRKTVHREQVVASWCLGTRRLYDLVDGNPMFQLHPLDYVCDPAVLARNARFVSVGQAFAVDLTGQVCADQFEGELYGGLSTQAEFLRAAATSPGGKAIVCLPSTTEDGTQSRIRPLLHPGEAVTIPRGDVHYVVTEWGSAYLYGKAVRERALELIEIAHPRFRPELLEEARRLGLARPDQQLRSVVAYPAEEERVVTLKGDRRVLLRPSKASDVEELQDLFYHLSEQDVYTRFFTRLASLSVSKAEHLCNVDYDGEMAFIAVAGEREDEFIVGSSCYYVDRATNLAEVAYMIRPEWQGVGLGGALQQRMMEYGKARGLRGFTANILAHNAKMRRLFQEGPNVSVELADGVYEVRMLF